MFKKNGFMHDFYDYKDEDTVISQKNISKEFNNRLRKFGYTKEVTSIWNNKPSIWVKNEK
jgi:HD superfamily phosphodiesterase